MNKADITNGFKPAGCKNIHLMTELARYPEATQFQCCCGMKYLYAHRDPDNISVRVNIAEGFDSRGGRVEMQGAKGLPMFGHREDDCPGAGAPLTCHGEYVWDGVMWSANLPSR